LLERYGKGPGNSERYRESMCIAADLKSIERAFLALPNDGILPKETLLVQSLKGMLRVDSRVSLIGHILGSDFEESLSTAQFIERCKAEVIIGNKTQDMESLGDNATDKMIKTLRQSNEDYKKEIEQTEKKQIVQLNKLKKILGLEMDLKGMAQNGPTQKDKITLEKNREAAKRTTNFTERNNDLTNKLEKTRKEVELVKRQIEDRSNYFERIIGNLNKELTELTTKCNNLKTEYYNMPDNMAIRIKNERKVRSERKQKELEERLDILFSSQGVLDQHIQVMTEATRQYEDAKKLLSEDYLAKMKESKKAQESRLENLAQQFEHYLANKRKKAKEFIQEAEIYCNKKRESNHKQKQELAKLYKIVEKQKTIIQKAEDGAYTQGIKSVIIDKIQYKAVIENIFSKKTGSLTSRLGTDKGQRIDSLPKLPKTNI